MEHGFKILSHVATPQHHYKNKNKKIQLGQICTRVSIWAFATSVACPPGLKMPESEMSPQVKQIRFSLEDSDQKELQL